MFCNTCEGKNNKGQRVEICAAGAPHQSMLSLKGIKQCQGCGCAISRVGFAVLPRGRYPMTRKERILDGRGRRARLGF